MTRCTSSLRLRMPVGPANERRVVALVHDHVGGRVNVGDVGRDWKRVLAESKILSRMVTVGFYIEFVETNVTSR